jgi:hypothetical protein
MNDAPANSDAATFADSAVIGVGEAPMDAMLALAAHFHVLGLLSILAWSGALCLAVYYFGSRRVAKVAAFVLMAWLGAILAWSCWKTSGLRSSEVNLGVQALAIWGAAGLLLLAFRKDPRLSPYRQLLGVGIAGLILATFNARNIDALGIDIAEQLEARQELVDAAVSEEERAAEARSSLDDVSLPHGEEEASIYEQAAAEEEDSEPLYRRQGKKTRAEGKKVETALSEATQIEGQAPEERVLVPEDQKYRAVTWASRNVFAARLAFLTVVLVLIGDYLRRFNSTLAFLYPLPIAGPLPDYFGSKAHTVALAPQQPELVSGLLASLVRKGETFIFFGSSPAIGDALCRLRLPGSERRLTVHHYDAQSPPASSEFVFESAWFGRYAFCIDNSLAPHMLDELLDFLNTRTPPQARSRRVLNLVIGADAKLSDTQHAALSQHCQAMNLRLIHLVDAPQAAYDEVVTELPADARSMLLQFAP